jgi:hypothetical protein
MKLWNWWIRDALGCKPKRYGRVPGKVDKSDLVFAAFMTSFAGLFALFLAFMLLAAIIASKGVVLVVLLIAGGLVYGIWKAIEITANGDNS